MIEEVKKIIDWIKMWFWRIFSCGIEDGSEVYGTDQCRTSQALLLDRPELRKKIRVILEYETSLCLKDDCNVESGSVACTECQLDQILPYLPDETACVGLELCCDLEAKIEEVKWQVINWLDEPCPHQYMFNHRWGCRACQDMLKDGSWQALKKEVS